MHYVEGSLVVLLLSTSPTARGDIERAGVRREVGYPSGLLLGKAMRRCVTATVTHPFRLRLMMAITLLGKEKLMIGDEFVAAVGASVLRRLQRVIVL